MNKLERKNETIEDENDFPKIHDVMKIRMKPKPKIKKKIFRLDTIQPMKVERLKE